MLSADAALKKILSAVSGSDDTQCETTDIYDCHTRVLAKDIYSKIDVPPADNSAMDGYAVASSSFASVSDEEALTLPISQRIAAGAKSQPLQPGTAARIFTGAEIPESADAVVMQENCQLESDTQVKILKKPSKNQNIRPLGQDIQRDARVATKGERVSPQLGGLLASIGVRNVPVFPRLNVSLLATGDELVEPGRPLRQGQIYNSNQAMLYHWLIALGCTIQRRCIVGDSFEQTVKILRECDADSDLIISSGGVSVGEEDHVKAALDHLGDMHLWKVAIKPGKPLAFGNLSRSRFLGLPGNPVSAFVTFMLFGVPLVNKMSGQNLEQRQGFFLKANFSSHAQSRQEYCRVKIVGDTVERFPNQSSGVLTSVCWADALAVIPCNTVINQGDLVEVLSFEGHLS